MLQDFKVLRKAVIGENKLGEPVYEFKSVHEFKGYIDLIGGSDQQTMNSAIVADSTHLILTEDVSFIPALADRIEHNNLVYEVTYSDNPMQRNHHLEIYLRRVV